MRFGSTNIVLKRGDITSEAVECIVNAANNHLLGGGGVDGAIHRAGGSRILEECLAIRARQGGCPTGSAVMTTGGNLPAKYVIHTVGPVWAGGKREEASLLRSCYAASLKLAAQHGLRTIAFPSISTGVYGYPISGAAPVALDAVRQFSNRSTTIEEVRFVLFSAQDLAVYQAALQHLLNVEANPS